MGYYSDVKFITTKSGWERIKATVKKEAPDTWEWKVGDEYATPICNGKHILLELNEVKWYDESDAEASFLRELNRFEAEHIPYRFMRIGEEYDDVEKRYEYDWTGGSDDDMPSLTLKREIEVEY